MQDRVDSRVKILLLSPIAHPPSFPRLPMNITNRTVWITGASSGIGEALTYAMSERGARLILSARRADELRAVRDHCAQPDRHHVVPLDLTDRSTLDAAVSDVLDDIGPVDLMVHNGGISQRSVVSETDLSVDRRIMEVNYFGAVTLTKLLLPSMLERGRGHFLVVSSLVGKFGTAKRSAYAASKHALHGFFDSLRAEVYDDGLRVTLFCPGFVKTNIGHNALTADGSAIQDNVEDVKEVGMPAETCAEVMIDAVEKEKDEVYYGGWERMGVYAKRLSPTLFNAVIRRMETT